MAAKLFAFAVWAVVAASGVFWGLRLTAAAPPVPPGATTAESTTVARGDLVRLFGAAPVQQAPVVMVPAESARFRLAGVVSPRARPSATVSGSRGGVALIAVDGKPARAVRVGARVDGDWVLQSVSLRSATVGAAGGSGSFQLDLPALPQPATGSLPNPYAAAGMAGGPAIVGNPAAQPGMQPNFATSPAAVDAGVQNTNDLPVNQMQQQMPMQPPPQPQPMPGNLPRPRPYGIAPTQ